MRKMLIELFVCLLGLLMLVSLVQAAPLKQESPQKTTVAILNITYENFPQELQEASERAFPDAFRADQRLTVITAAAIDTLATTPDPLATAQMLHADYLLTGELRKIGALIVMKLRFFDVATGTEEKVNLNTKEEDLVGATIPSVVAERIANMKIREVPPDGGSNWWKWAVGGVTLAAGTVTFVMLRGGGQEELPGPGAIPDDLLGN